MKSYICFDSFQKNVNQITDLKLEKVTNLGKPKKTLNQITDLK